MPERPVSPGPGRDDAPGREEDWLAWCEALEASGQPLGPDEEDPEEDAVLDPVEARAAEKLVLDRAGRLTPGGLRAAIARAVMEENMPV